MTLITTARRALLLALMAPVALLAQKPTVRQVLDRHAAAVGGVPAHQALAGVTMRGTIDLTFAGLTGPYESRTAPGRTRVSFELGPVGTVSQGFDGTVAWAMDPNGARKLTGEDLASARNSASMTAGLYPEGSYTSAEVLDEAAFEGKPCWPVRLTLTSGRVLTVFYDKATGLKAGQSSTSSEGVENKIAFDDYKPFGTIRVPTKQVRTTPNGDIVIAITSVNFDAIDPTVFALPEAVKSLP